MTRVLVLTVDRDNDLGIKTSIRGPVIGRRQVLTAALKLGIAIQKKAIQTLFLGLFLNTILCLKQVEKMMKLRLQFSLGTKRSVYALTVQLLRN